MTVTDLLSTLASALQDADPHVRKVGCRALMGIGWEAAIPAIVNLLIERLADHELEPRVAAGEALPAMNVRAVAPLVTALHHKDELVRSGAAWALSKMGSLGKSGISDLLIALKDSDYTVRRGAALALQSIGARTPEVLSALVEALSDSDMVVRATAGETILETDKETLLAFIAQTHR